jgi:hypothetical protein
MRLAALAPLLFSLTTEAQEVVTVASRPGVTQSFFVAGMGERKAEALALLYVGGGGSIRLRMEKGQPTFGANNFLPRARGEFIRNGILPVVMDAPSDQLGGLTDYYRVSDQQSADARAVVAEVRKRYPRQPLFIVGTSKGTVTAAYVGRALGGDIAGVVLTSSLFAPPRGATLAGFNYGSIKAPLLFVHHREDACEATPYAEAYGLASRYPLISVKGGKAPESGPCDPYGPHGFYGKEPGTIGAIAAWMLKKPFPREIE